MKVKSWFKVLFGVQILLTLVVFICFLMIGTVDANWTLSTPSCPNGVDVFHTSEGQQIQCKEERLNRYVSPAAVVLARLAIALSLICLFAGGVIWSVNK